MTAECIYCQAPFIKHMGRGIVIKLTRAMHLTFAINAETQILDKGRKPSTELEWHIYRLNNKRP